MSEEIKTVTEEIKRQRQKISYQAIDETTGKEIIGLDFRRGMMTPDQMKADEKELLPVFVKLMQTAQATV